MKQAHKKKSNVSFEQGFGFDYSLTTLPVLSGIRGERIETMIALPTRNGWIVSWYTGEVKPKTRRMKDGTRKVIGEIRMCDSFESTSKEAVLRKKKELEDAGFEIEMFTECIF